MTSSTWTPLLTGVVGSTAYGLATPESDIDILSTAVAPTTEFLGLNGLSDKMSSRVSFGPDSVQHEIGKFLRLCLKANPTVTELLWLEDYGLGHPQLGEELIGLRKTLLGGNAVRNAYLGYASRQFEKAAHRGDGTFSSDTRNRVAKHARHMMRLLTQGAQLYITGELQVRLENPQEYHDFGAMMASDPERGLELAKEKLSTAEHIFDEYTSALPDEPDHLVAEQWLIEVRRRFMNGDGR